LLKDATQIWAFKRNFAGTKIMNPVTKKIETTKFFYTASASGNSTPSSLQSHDVSHSPTVIFIPTSSQMSMDARSNY